MKNVHVQRASAPNRADANAHFIRHRTPRLALWRRAALHDTRHHQMHQSAE